MDEYLEGEKVPSDSQLLDWFDEWLTYEGYDQWKVEDCAVRMVLGHFSGHDTIREAIRAAMKAEETQAVGINTEQEGD